MHAIMRTALTLALGVTILAGGWVSPGLAQAPLGSTDDAVAPADTTATGAETERISDEERRRLKATLEQLGRSEISGPRQWERGKNPRLAMLSSALLPGLGQVYNGRRLKVAVMLGFVAYYGGNMALSWKKHKYHEARRETLPVNSTAWQNENILSEFEEERAIDFLWWSGAVWLIGILDSWIDAHLYDVRGYDPGATESPQTEAMLPRIGIGSGNSGQRYVTFSIGF